MIESDATRMSKSNISIFGFSWKRILLVSLNVVLLVIFVRWFAANIHVPQLLRYFSLIPFWAILGSMLINVAALVLYGLRMACILRIGFGRSFCVVNMGYALNNVMPLRLGEALKIVFARQLFAIPAPRLFMGTILEKLADLFTIILLALVLIAVGAPRFVGAGELVVPTIVALGAILMFFALRFVLPRINNMLPEGNRLRWLLIELREHSTDYPVGRILLLTISIWVLNGAVVYFAFNTYLGDIGFGLLDATALLIILALAIALPSTPASIGLFEAGVVVYLTQFFQVGQEAALAAAFMLHLASSLPQLAVLGMVFLRHRMGLIERPVA